jgi:predicted ABC-type ATPase
MISHESWFSLPAEEQANAKAWQEGLRRLDEAIARRSSYAFETTLGGKTITARLAAASSTHDVEVWYCGLASVRLHMIRVARRVSGGGHDIPEALIRSRYRSALQNLISLLPRLAFLRVYDNSAEADAGGTIPDPVLVLEVNQGKVVFPAADDASELRATPAWAKALVEAALRP